MGLMNKTVCSARVDFHGVRDWEERERKRGEAEPHLEASVSYPQDIPELDCGRPSTTLLAPLTAVSLIRNSVAQPELTGPIMFLLGRASETLLAGPEQSRMVAFGSRNSYLTAIKRARDGSEGVYDAMTAAAPTLVEGTERAGDIAASASLMRGRKGRMWAKLDAPRRGPGFFMFYSLAALIQDGAQRHSYEEFGQPVGHCLAFLKDMGDRVKPVGREDYSALTTLKSQLMLIGFLTEVVQAEDSSAKVTEIGQLLEIPSRRAAPNRKPPLPGSTDAPASVKSDRPAATEKAPDRLVAVAEVTFYGASALASDQTAATQLGAAVSWPTGTQRVDGNRPAATLMVPLLLSQLIRSSAQQPALAQAMVALTESAVPALLGGPERARTLTLAQGVDAFAGPGQPDMSPEQHAIRRVVAELAFDIPRLVHHPSGPGDTAVVVELRDGGGYDHWARLDPPETEPPYLSFWTLAALLMDGVASHDYWDFSFPIGCCFMMVARVFALAYEQDGHPEALLTDETRGKLDMALGMLLRIPDPDNEIKQDLYTSMVLSPG